MLSMRTRNFEQTAHALLPEDTQRRISDGVRENDASPLHINLVLSIHCKW